MKIRWMQYGFTLIFLILLGYLFKLQVVDYDYYLKRSEENRIRPVILEAPRGIILDRNGDELVRNRLSFDCYILPHKPQHIDSTLEEISKIIILPLDKLKKNYKARYRNPYLPVLLAADISKEQAIRLEEEIDHLSGVFVKTRPVREYVMGSAGAHIIGYIGAIDKNEYKKMRPYGYIYSDRVGRDGIEKIYDHYLRGQHGASKIEVDSRGRLLRVLGIQERRRGNVLELTLDKSIQELFHKEMKDRPGAGIAIDLNEGGVIALVSTPSYDPNFFARPYQFQKQIINLLEDKNKPLMNRALSGEYPPGSTFKIISAIAGLRSNIVDSDLHFFCPGSFFISGFEFKCWRKSGHGSQNIISALQNSCNVYFYQLGQRLGVSLLEKEAIRFGLGKKTNVDLPQEKRGLAPGVSWKRKMLKEKWYGGETLNYSIGQGYLLTTPMQMLRVVAAAATGGKLFKPFIVKKINDVDISPRKIGKVKAKEEHFKIIENALSNVVNESHSTGQYARSDIIKIAGKTGTAQAPHGEDHAWFVGYAPVDNPQVAIVVFFENGGKGGAVAAPVAKRVFEYMMNQGYFV